MSSTTQRPAQSSLIHIEHLTHRYAGTDAAALNDISLSIPAGCSFGLLGPNGAGKTTLLSILTGLQAPQSGSVRIAGLDVTHDAADIKRISAYVPQDFAFYLALSGRENLHFFADIYGLSRTQWHQRLEQVSNICCLQDLLDKRTEHYSGGMKRRLNLAIGLLNAPQILYLDEPTVGIDALSRQVIVASIQSLRAQGTTVIYTSHYMEEVEALCDEIAIINHGKLVARDTTANLLQQGHQKTLLLTFTHRPDTSALQALHPWTPQSLHEKQYELTLDDAQQLSEILTTCQQQDLQLEQAQFGISKLERIYLTLLNPVPPREQTT
ncbi:MAG: ABC transporter ATP-binding protein [Steroidobacteraceae bacterium]